MINNERMGFDNLSMHIIGSKNRERRVAIIKFELREENCFGGIFSFSNVLFSFYLLSPTLFLARTYTSPSPHTSQSLLVCHCTYVCIPPFPFRPPHPRRIARQTDSIPFFGGEGDDREPESPICPYPFIYIYYPSEIF